MDRITPPPGQMCVIVCPVSSYRKMIHQYLDARVSKASIRVSSHYAEIATRYVRCYECDYTRVMLTDYHYGDEPNNIDESRSGTCRKCGGYIIFEPNYDDWDDVVTIARNNAIVVGDVVKHYNHPSHSTPGDVSLEDFTRIVSNTPIYVLDAPIGGTAVWNKIKKVDLQRYADDGISRITA